MIYYFYTYLNIIYKNIAFFVVKITLDLNIKAYLLFFMILSEKI